MSDHDRKRSSTGGTAFWLFCAFAVAASIAYFGLSRPYPAAAGGLGGAALFFLLIYLFATPEYLNNCLRHFVAPLTGEGLSDRLARDFWPSEDIWSSDRQIRLRWLKLSYVYSASVVAQLTIPLTVAFIVIHLFVRPLSFRWWLIGVGGITVLLLTFAVLVATLTYLRVNNNQRGA